MRALCFILFSCSMIAAAQQVGANSTGNSVAQDPQGMKLQLGSQLVIETVAVTDKRGHAVAGLTANDFAVTEDGAQQAIKVFEYQDLALNDTQTQPQEPERARIFKELGKTQISPERPGETKHKDKRLLALYFDMTAMPSGDQIRALSAADSFVRTQMTANDQVAILRYAGSSVEVLQDFTSDRNRLRSILETLIVGEGQGFGESTNDASSPDTGAAFGQDDSEFNIFNTDRQLSALQTTAGMLALLSEKKLLVYFSSGLRLNGLDNQAQLRATINAAVRAGVAFWPIDARGLVATPPLGDATVAAPGGNGSYSGAAFAATVGNFQQSQDTLYSLASDTGGKAQFDTNDLGQGIVNALRSEASYYVVGYYATNTALDGRFRRIDIKLTNGLQAELNYRHGYFAGKRFANFTAADKERQLEDALMLPDPMTDLAIAMEIDYFQLDRAEYFVPVTVKIPGRELALAKRGGAQQTVIDFIGEIKDQFGATVANVRDKVSAKLSETTATELGHRPVVYNTGFTLLPGKYTIKFLARDDETGRIGTFQTDFVIPNLNKEDRRLPISSVVLSSQRAERKEAIYSAQKKQAKTETAHPLVENGQMLIPSVTRVFRQSQTMFVYLQAYEPNASPATPVVAEVSLYRDGKKVFESGPAESVKASGRLNILALAFSIPLSGLAGGEYECQVSVLDPEGRKANFWRAPVVVI